MKNRRPLQRKRVIVDTSVWIQHERKLDPFLVELIQRDQVLLHWAVYGELSVGNIRDRKSYLKDLSMFARLEVFSPLQLFEFIETEELFGKGLSLVDCILLLSAKVENVLLYSQEKKLNTYHPL